MEDEGLTLRNSFERIGYYFTSQEMLVCRVETYYYRKEKSRMYIRGRQIIYSLLTFENLIHFRSFCSSVFNL